MSILIKRTSIIVNSSTHDTGAFEIHFDDSPIRILISIAISDRSIYDRATFRLTTAVYAILAVLCFHFFFASGLLVYRELVSRCTYERILLGHDSRVSFQWDGMWHFNALFQPAKCLICKTRTRLGRSFTVHVSLSCALPFYRDSSSGSFSLSLPLPLPFRQFSLFLLLFSVSSSFDR